MADTSPLLASLLLGQKRRTDPLEAQRKFGQELIIKGGSTAPLGSGNALEGLARALQGGLGGLVAGYADQQEQEKGKKQVETLSKISGANSKDELTAAIKGSELDSDLAGPLMAQLLQQKQAQFQRGTVADTMFPQGGAPGTPGPGLVINMNKPTQVSGTIPPEWEPHIQKAAQATGLPVDLLKRQLLAESGGNANAVSPAGAGGPAQLMPGTATDLGVTNRFDPATSIPAGATYLKQQFDKYGGNLNHALAAYNFGPGNVDNWLKGGGDPSKLPQETQAYIAKVAGGPQQPGIPQQGDAPQVAQAPSATSEPPTVPRPQLSPERQQFYRNAVNAGAMTGEQAAQGAYKETHDQWQADQLRATEIWKDQQQSKRIQETGAQQLGQKAPMEMIAKRVDNYETKVRPAAMAAINDIQSIHQTRQVLDAGAFTGTGAEAKTLAAKIGEQLGIPSEQAQNTQVLGATLAKRVLAGAGGTLGTGFSNADRDFMEKAQGGQLSMDEGALRRILDIGEKQARQTLKNHDVEAARVQQLPGMGQLGSQQFQVPQAPAYDEFNKANPLAPLQTGPAAPQAATADIPMVNTPDEARKLPPGTTFRTPDGRTLVR